MNDKVIYVGAFELPDKNAAANRVVANGKILQSLGFNTVYVGFGHAIKNSIHREVLEGSEYFTLNAPTNLKDSLRYLASISFIEEILGTDKERYPIAIIAYNYPFIALFRLHKFCLRNNIRLVADCTEWYDNPKGTIGYRTIKNVDMFCRIRIIQPKLHGIIVISKFLYDYYHKKTRNIALLPPLVDVTDPKWTKKSLKAGTGAVKLIYAGSPGKGTKDRLDVIINALSVIKERYSVRFELTVVGLTEADYLRDFSVSSLPANIREYIIFLGRLAHSDVLEETKNSDYVIFYRDRNLGNTAGFPSKFVEAFSCGVPVLTNGTSNICDYLKDGVNGYLINDSDSDALVSSIQRALSATKEDIYRMKENLINNNPFDYRNYRGELESFFKKLLQQ